MFWIVRLLRGGGEGELGELGFLFMMGGGGGGSFIVSEGFGFFDFFLFLFFDGFMI